MKRLFRQPKMVFRRPKRSCRRPKRSFRRAKLSFRLSQRPGRSLSRSRRPSQGTPTLVLLRLGPPMSRASRLLANARPGLRMIASPRRSILAPSQVFLVPSRARRLPRPWAPTGVRASQPRLRATPPPVRPRKTSRRSCPRQPPRPAPPQQRPTLPRQDRLRLRWQQSKLPGQRYVVSCRGAPNRGSAVAGSSAPDQMASCSASPTSSTAIVVPTVPTRSKLLCRPDSVRRFDSILLSTAMRLFLPLAAVRPPRPRRPPLKHSRRILTASILPSSPMHPPTKLMGWACSPRLSQAPR